MASLSSSARIFGVSFVGRATLETTSTTSQARRDQRPEPPRRAWRGWRGDLRAGKKDAFHRLRLHIEVTENKSSAREFSSCRGPVGMAIVLPEVGEKLLIGEPEGTTMRDHISTQNDQGLSIGGGATSLRTSAMSTLRSSSALELALRSVTVTVSKRMCGCAAVVTPMKAEMKRCAIPPAGPVVMRRVAFGDQTYNMPAAQTATRMAPASNSVARARQSQAEYPQHATFSFGAQGALITVIQDSTETSRAQVSPPRLFRDGQRPPPRRRRSYDSSLSTNRARAQSAGLGNFATVELAGTDSVQAEALGREIERRRAV